MGEKVLPQLKNESHLSFYKTKKAEYKILFKNFKR